MGIKFYNQWDSKSPYRQQCEVIFFDILSIQSYKLNNGKFAIDFAILGLGFRLYIRRH